jgi:paraquat-inducible protein B
MIDDTPHPDPAKHAKAPHAAYRHRDYSYVWIVPVLALIVVGWMAWTTWRSTGPIIHISFEKADGIDANRTQIRHKGVVLGTVTGLTPSKDFSHVTVTAKMGAIVDPYLTSGAQLWIVRPRVSVGAISDLNTLVSGVYIELTPGKGDATHDFVGREEPLAVDPQAAGKSFVLRAPEMGSLERGSPLYYHGIQAGEVTAYDLDKDGNVLIHIFVRAPYDKLVLGQTRFWKASGIGITAGATGIKIAAQSLQAIVEGGIVFDLPDNTSADAQAAPDSMFPLYPDRDAANDSVYTKMIFYRLTFDGSIAGLDSGAGVTLLGDRIGHVVQTWVEVDGAAGTAVTRATIEIQPERIRFVDKDKDAAIDIEKRARDALRAMVRHKLRARIASANLITGQKSIDLAFVPDAPAAEVSQPVEPNATEELPTVAPNDINGVIQDVHTVLADTDHLVKGLGPEIQPLITSLRTTTDQINGQISTDEGQGGLSGTLYELRQAAQSVRGLADYLDAHPESILRGKEAP